MDAPAIVIKHAAVRWIEQPVNRIQRQLCRVIAVFPSVPFVIALRIGEKLARDLVVGIIRVEAAERIRLRHDAQHGSIAELASGLHAVANHERHAELSRECRASRLAPDAETGYELGRFTLQRGAKIEPLDRSGGTRQRE